METSAGPGSTFSTQCSSCDSSSPSSWCVDCNEALCSSCLLAHRRVTVTRSHQILDQPPAGAVKTPPTKFCKLHPSEPLKLFCFTCHQLTCRDCQLTRHMNHRYQFVSEALDKLKKRMECLLQPIRSQSDTMRRSLRDMETRLQDITESEAHLQNELHHANRVLIQHMMNRTTEILKKVKEVSEQESEQIRARVRKLKQLQEQRQALAESAEAAINTSDLSQLLHFASQVQALTRRVSDQDLSPPQNMVLLKVITDKPALEAILNFGILQVDSIPFSVTQRSPQNTYDPAVVPVKSLSSQSSASPSCSLPTSLPCVPSAGSSTVPGPSQTVGSDRQLMSQTQPVNTFVVLQPFHQATNVLKVVMNQQTAPPQNQPADAPAVYQMPFGVNQLPFNVSYAQPGLARSSTRGATNQTAVNKQTRGRNQVLIVRTTGTTAGPSHHVPQQQTSHQNPLLVHKQTAYIRKCVDNKQTHQQPLTVQNQIPDHQPYRDPNPPLNHKQTPLNQPPPARKRIPAMKMPEKPKVLRQLIIKDAEQTSGPQPVPENHQQPPDLQPSPENQLQVFTPTLLSEQLLQYRSSPLHQQSQEASPLPGGLPHQHQHSFLNHKLTPLIQPLPVRKLMPDTQILKSNITLKWLLIQDHQQTSDPQPVPENHQQTSDPQPVPGNPQQTSDLQPVPENHKQTSDPQPVPENPQQTSDPQPVPGNHKQTSDPQPVPGNHKQTSDPQPVPGNHKQTSDPQPVPGNHKQTPGNQSWQQQKQPPDLQPSPENQPQVLTTPTALSEQLLQDRPSPFNARSQESPPLLGIEPSPLHEQSQDEPSTSPVHSQSADQQALLAHQTSVALSQTADNEEAPEHQPLQDERPPYAPSLSHLSPASSVKAHPSSLVVKAVADSACDSSVQQVTLRHQEPAENEPTSTVSEEPEPSDCTPHAVDSDTEDPGSETRSQDFKLSLWQPTVSLDRLPLALSHPGSRLPSFRLVPGDAEDEFYLEELSEDSESHDADEHSKSGDEEVPDSYTEPLSSPDSPLTLQTVSCSVCNSANGSIICTACGRGYHRNCHLPPIGDDIWMDWTCTLCQDLTEPPHPYRPPRPQSPSLSLLDQRRCETLLLFLKVEGYAFLSQMDWVWSRLTTMSERLTQQRPPKYETSAELLYDIWRLFKDASQDNASVNVLLENFESKVKETFSSDLTHPDQNLPRCSSHTKPAKTHTGPAVMSQEGSEVEEVLNDKCELKNTRKRPGDCSDLNEARKRKTKSDL